MAWKCECCTKISGLIAAIVIVFFSSSVSGQQSDEGSLISQYEAEIKQKTGALDSIKAQLKKGRTRLAELQKEEGNYLGRLEQLEKNIAASEEYLNLLTEQIDTVVVTISLLGDSLKAAGMWLDYSRELMKKRLRMAYTRGDYNRLQVLFSARSPVEFIHRVKYLQELNNYDQRLAQRIRETISSVELTRSSQEKRRRELEEFYIAKKDEQQELLQEESSRRSVLEDIRNEKTSYAAIVKELEASQRELDGIVKLLESRRKKAREDLERRSVITFEKLRGKLPWPVRGKVVSEYGKVTHPVYKTVIMNNGIDIEAPRGESVVSVAPGNVAYIGWMRGLGRIVIVEHQGGYITIYAHLGDIGVQQDEEVVTGSVLGNVGETGTAGGAKLHFEIRQSSQSLDPRVWLEKQN